MQTGNPLKMTWIRRKLAPGCGLVDELASQLASQLANLSATSEPVGGANAVKFTVVVVVVVVLIRCRRADAPKTLILVLSLSCFIWSYLTASLLFFSILLSLLRCQGRNATCSSFHSCLVAIRLPPALLARSAAVYVQHTVWKEEN